jgi:hypothetical protein
MAPVTAIDLFDKTDSATTEKILREWREKVGGDVFIP